MKKIFLSLIAVMATMSISAQVVKVYKNGELVSTYTNTSTDKYKVVFEEETSGTTNGHEWVKIGGVKWATMNVGATTVAGSPATCYGDYYAWGETEPRYTSITISGDGISATFWGWNRSHSNGYYKEDPPTYSGTTLDADHDVATVKWGSDWHTPTISDYKKLYEACGGTDDYISSTLPIGTTSTTDKGIYWCNDYDGVKGLLFSDGRNKVFFPSAGFCSVNVLGYGSTGGIYWASSINTEKNEAYSLDFDYEYVDPLNDYGLYDGCTIRPVSE